ncbi:MAG TPA: 16S rRNA (cytidine(1402)-2'-O)-methyltransferase [Bdellovibrionota bacterium]|jgi:16S rRNA (cytidine1402-2'-O)-methyltransferase
MKGQAEELSPGLYVVATPIGNLEDLGFRALRVLKQSRWIAAEDTRETRKLLDHYGIKSELRSLHEHSTLSRVEELVESLKGGGVGAYVSDAGTPGLCDPGPALVQACVKAGIPVYPVPGASALLALLSISGIPGTAFSFHGFFPREKKDREEWSERAGKQGGLQLFYESPHRIKETLAFLSKQFSQSPLIVGRELTKRFETITRGSSREVAETLEAEEPRGEYVLALQLPEIEEEQCAALGRDALKELVKELTDLGAGQKVLTRVAMSHGLRKNEAYKLALEMMEK